MAEDPPSKETKSTGFWNTTLGTITKITALVSAISGLILAIKPLFGKKDKPDNPTVLLPEKPTPQAHDSIDEVESPHAVEPQPIKEFTLTRDQQQVFNDLKITMTLPDQQINPITNTIRIRLWRMIEQPISDTANLDPSSSQPGVSYLLFRLNAITPVSIPDGRQFRFIFSNALLNGKRVESVEVKMYRN